MTRLPYLGLAASTILAGLVLRLVPWGLPLRVHHVGGGLLWGAMLFLLVAGLRPPGWSWANVLAAAAAIALGIELTRLHTNPTLDAFQTTLPGQLLLGRIFSAWNLVTYASGILAAAAATRGIAWTDRAARPRA